MHCGMCVRPHRPPPSSSDEKDPSPSEDEQMRASATDEPDGSEHAGAYGSDSASNAGGGGSESGTRVSVLGNDMTEEACERRYGCRQTDGLSSTVPTLCRAGRTHSITVMAQPPLVVDCTSATEPTEKYSGVLAVL